MHELSQLLRHVVYDNPGRVALGREIDFLDNYISLMRLRMGSRPVDFRTDIADPERPVAPLLFMTLVENAFKHGATSPADRPVRIEVTDRDGMLVCTTFNHFARRAEGSGDGAGGVGLANLRRRLELIYGRRASLMTEATGSTFTATLKITGQS